MRRRKREPMNPAKKNIVRELIKTYDIKTANDIQEALKDLLGETLKDMLEAEMNEHLGYEKYSRDEDVENSRNGYKSKKVRSSIGEFEIDVPQDRESQFEPKVIKKRQKDISEIEQKIINMYASGLTNKTIVEEIEDIYGFEVSESMISDITDKVIPRIEEWKSRPLDSVYPVIYIDAVHFSVKDDVSEKWSEKYPNSLKSWYTNWDCIIPIFKFSPETRRVIYTTNAIESLNAQFKRLNRNRSVFPTKSSLEKALFLSVEKISKKWTHPIRNWGSIFGELSIMFEERISY
ncbi:IS256 family transposase [Peptostreptococcus anaerobius]